jgi:DNA topoisomerase-1
VIDALNELLADHLFPALADGGDPRECPACKAGKLSLKLGKFGAFIGCSNYPECRFTRQLGVSGEDAVAAAGVSPEGTALGEDPDSGLAVMLRTGRFGPYLQLGPDPTEKGAEKPKRASIPKGWTLDQIDIEAALKLLSLPREIGIHPETGAPITAGIGRYGPFVENAGKYANLDSVDEVFTVGANRAISLLAEKKSGRGRATPSALKNLGDHPTEGGVITVRSGRYGPYVNHGKVNATLPRNMNPEGVTLEQALQLLAEKAGRAPAKKTASKGRKAPAKKPRAKAKATVE